MSTINKLHNSMSHDNNNGSFESILIGFVLAVGNHVFGWFNHIFGQVQPTSHWVEWGQAILTGALGATGAFFANRLWKLISKKFSNKHTQ